MVIIGESRADTDAPPNIESIAAIAMSDIGD